MEKDKIQNGSRNFVNEVKNHLETKIIPFWEGLKDEEKGGYYGYVDYNLVVDKKAVKGCILNSRLLWFFSNAYMVLGDEKLLSHAGHAYSFLKEHCIDKEYGGVYWSLNYEGRPEDSTKHTYNQAFAIYALASYYDASKNKEALDLAMKLYGIIEEKCKDEGGYLEAFNEKFEPEVNEKLSENGIVAERTMNTTLHVFEAYTELYRVTGNKDVEKNLYFILDLISEKIYNKEIGRQEVFFDKNWNSLIDLYSFGHDIETSWLLDRGVEILNNRKYCEKIGAISSIITSNIYDKAYIDNSLVNESECGKVDKTRVWWVQAEAVVGFLNGYEKSGNEKYLSASIDIWNFIKKYVVDSRDGSEWYWALNDNREPLTKPIVEPWKCPYHNGRMCFEVIRRLKDAS